MTVWSMMGGCVGQLGEPFRRGEIAVWLRHHPGISDAAPATRIAAPDAANGAKSQPLGMRAPRCGEPITACLSAPLSYRN